MSSIPFDPDQFRLLRQRVADLEGVVNSDVERKSLRATPVGTIGTAVRAALAAANAQLADEENEYTVADLECELKGIVGIRGETLTIDFSVDAPAEAMSVIRLGVARVPRSS